jgi:hypothetical protein
MGYGLVNWIYWHTCTYHSELHFTDHWHTQTNVCNLLVSTRRFLATNLTLWEFFSFPHSGLLVMATHTELYSTDNSANWDLGWWSFNTTLLVFPLQADFQLNWQLNCLTHQPASCHFSQLNCWQLTPESELLYDWWFTANQFILVTNPLRLTTSNFIFNLNTCGYSPYVTPSLRRGYVCHLHLLLVLASIVILRSKSSWAQDEILLSQIWDFPNLEGHVPIFIAPRNRVAKLYPQALGSLFVASYDSQGYGGGIWF